MSSVLEYSSSQLPDIVEAGSSSEFSRELRAGWRRARADGALRYDVGELRTRQVQGAYSYLLQLNPERGSQRRPPEPIHDIRQEFDPSSFHFGRVPATEVVLRLRSADRDGDEHLVLVNVSPISELHSLLCPSVRRLLPQVVTADSLRVALEVYFLAGDRQLRIGFNSLCALASVNHLHYHLLVEGATLPVERAKCQHLTGPLYCFEDYPAQAFCFQLRNKQDIDNTVQDVYKLLQYLLENNVAHNLMVTRGESLDGGAAESVRVVVWPRRSSYGAKQFDAFNVAVCELSGWFPVFKEEDFIRLQASEVEHELQTWRLDAFEEMTKAVTQLYSSDCPVVK